MNPLDCDVHRFLRQVGDKVQVWRFTRVPFSNKSSPFLLNATIQHHLEQQPPSRVVSELSSSLYVDDWLSGADSADDAQAMFDEARNIMSQASMPLVKWNSNSKALLDVVSETSGQKMLAEAGTILGVRWSPEIDCFSFDGCSIPADLSPTKRILLSCIARLYDPLGFLCPFVMQAKILFQDAWRLGLGWDALLPDELRGEFSRWLDGLAELRAWKIPRRHSPDQAWRDLQNVELHAFSDASERGYGGVVYLYYQSGDTFKTSLITARARVVPLKRVTLPRLELLGALLACRLVRNVLNALCLPESTPLTFWCDSMIDSMITLGWIRGDPQRWKPFVANRVREIQNLSDPSSWHHCPGNNNPADLFTRGASASTLMTSPMWLLGPDIPSLKQQCPNVCVAAVVHSLEELCLVKSATIPPSDVLPFSRFSTWQRARNIVAYVLRFANNARRSRTNRVAGELTAS